MDIDSVIPYDRMIISDDGRYIIDSSPRSTGKSYYLKKYVDYLCTYQSCYQGSPSIRFVGSVNSYSHLGGQGLIVSADNIHNISNTIYFIDEFDNAIQSRDIVERILCNTQSNFYINGTPCQYGSLLDMLCYHIINNEYAQTSSYNSEYMGEIDMIDSPDSKFLKRMGV